MDDGTKNGPGFIFCIYSYTLSEVELLIKVLKDKFELNCSLQIHRKDQKKIIFHLNLWTNFNLL